MISLCIGSDLDMFLRRLEAAPELYAQIVICTPFLDGPRRERLAKLAVAAEKAGCGVRVITAEHTANSFGATEFPRRLQMGTRSLIGHARLHAKVYLALARKRRNSILVLTSANLTAAGLRRNAELGVIFRADDEQAAEVVEQARIVLESWAARPERTVWKRQ